MIWARRNSERVKALKTGEKASCPLCSKQVIPKCGEIKIWHWAHKIDFECDSFGEPESEWHLNWKNKFLKEQQEVAIKNHIADIKNKNGLIIELQNSPISPYNIREREEFYGKMIWLLNGKTLAKNLELRQKSYGLSFRWKWFPKSWEVAKKPIYIDFSNLYGDVEIFLIKKFYFSKYIAGWGKEITKKDFLKIFRGRNE